MGLEWLQEGFADNHPMRPTPRYKIPNYKHQITNKSQITIFNDQNAIFGILNFGNWYLFEICFLVLVIFIERVALFIPANYLQHWGQPGVVKIVYFHKGFLSPFLFLDKLVQF